ncbi:hypothetical protein [Mucilaginibacter sp.]
MNTQEYIESGILELYVLGAATDVETKELLYFKEHYPEIRNALYELETDMERLAQQMAIMPPPGTWEKIEDKMHELSTIPEYEPLKFKQGANGNGNYNARKSDQFIEVEAESSQIRVHKNWKWVFAAVFILSKVFLACAIYFYLENRQAQQQILELKTELRTHKAPY